MSLKMLFWQIIFVFFLLPWIRLLIVLEFWETLDDEPFYVINFNTLIVITQYIRDSDFVVRISLFYVKFWKLLGGFTINAYICTA